MLAVTITESSYAVSAPGAPGEMAVMAMSRGTVTNVITGHVLDHVLPWLVARQPGDYIRKRHVSHNYHLKETFARSAEPEPFM
jgi:hypothetical protein